MPCVRNITGYLFCFRRILQKSKQTISSSVILYIIDGADLHSANIRVETGKDNFSRAAVLQNSFDNCVYIDVEFERMIQLISAIL